MWIIILFKLYSLSDCRVIETSSEQDVVQFSVHDEVQEGSVGREPQVRDEEGFGGDGDAGRSRCFYALLIHINDGLEKIYKGV